MSDPLAVTGIFMLGASAGALVTYIKHRCTLLEAQKILCQQPVGTRDRAVDCKSHPGMKALIVGRDPKMINLFSHVFRDRGIETQECFSESAALEQLSSARFQALVLDSDEMDSAKILKDPPRSNQRVLVIAIATLGKKKAAAGAGVSFVVERPLALDHVREVLRAAYGRILREGQQYFRLTAELPVSIRKASGAVVQGMTLNVSQTGMAVKSEAGFTAGEPVNIAFAVPNTDIVISACGKIIWDDKHGKTGISFQCDSSSAQSRYQEWLHDHFFMMQNNFSPLQRWEQEWEPYRGQQFIQKGFKVSDLACPRSGSERRLRQSGTVGHTEKSGYLLGSCG